MAMNDQEIEVKFYVRRLSEVQARLQALGAVLAQPRTHEFNLRFDTPDLALTHSSRALRLRQDTAARLTFKGPPRGEGGVRVRQEIEFVVGDFRAARAFLEALGYQVSLIYEKYRAVYDYGDFHIALDELPYGNFIEIEGPDPAAIQEINRSLGLDWAASVPVSYSMLFDQLRARLGLDFRDLIFDNFASLSITPEALGVRPADK
jgi:adenylate cyclase class 2